jgi:hypothetical protein
VARTAYVPAGPGGASGQRRGERPPTVIVVVDGADQRGADSVKRELGLDFVVLPDPEGTITDRFGIGVWPTTLTLDRAGIVSDIEFGLAERSDDGGRRWGEDLRGSDTTV